MNMTVWKFTLNPLETIQILYMPAGAQILCLQTQNNEPQIWALCNSDPEWKRENRHFLVYTTGARISVDSAPYVGKYIGTAQLIGGDYVIHVFEYPCDTRV